MAAGYRGTYESDDLSDFDTKVRRVLQEAGPVLIDLKVEPGESYPQPYETIYGAAIQEAFKSALRSA